MENFIRFHKRFVRAFCHFELIRNFASKYETGGLDVAYMEQSVISLPSRRSFEATMPKIKADMLAAKPLIPTYFADKTRITKAAIAAMQARVALYKKTGTMRSRIQQKPLTCFR